MPNIEFCKKSQLRQKPTGSVQKGVLERKHAQFPPRKQDLHDKSRKISTGNTENTSNVYLQLLTNKMLKEISIIVIGYEINRNYTV